MTSRLLLLGFAILPAVSLAALFGPLRRRDNRIAGGAFLALAAVCLGTALLVASGRPGQQGRVLAAALAVLLAPSGATFVALRTAAVRADWRLVFVMLPLGYFAGCGLAIQVLAKLGVVL